MKIKTFLTIICIVFSKIIVTYAAPIPLEEAFKNPSSNYQRNQELLLHVPTSKSTVGILLLKKANDKLYLLIARERIDGKDPKKAGTFCDLGGSVELKTRQNVLQNMFRELNEESVESFTLDSEDFLKNAATLFLKNGDRAVYYSVYLIDDSLYKTADFLNDKRAEYYRLNCEDIYLEKDQYLWIDTEALQSINQATILVRDIEQHFHFITFRNYFLKDCLQNADFALILKNFKNEIE